MLDFYEIRRNKHLNKAFANIPRTCTEQGTLGSSARRDVVAFRRFYKRKEVEVSFLL